MDKNTAQQLDVKSRHDLLLLDVEGIDEFWGPTFRSIYETEDHEKFLEHLNNRIKSYDKEIELMCNYHYQGFIESIRELLQLKTQVHELNQELNEIDQQLQASASGVMSVATQLVKERKTERNIALTIESLSRCLPVLKTYQKLQKQMSEKRFYPALKTLERLEKLQLQIPTTYKFSIQIRESIPQLRQSIKDASMSDLKDFLENIRKFSPKIGEVAMRHTSEQSSGSCNLAIFAKKNHEDLDSLTAAVVDSEEDLSAQDLIDFSPVYRCLHIHSVLNAKEEFESYYRKQRRQQARLVLQSSANMHEDLKNFRLYLHAIAGFFVVENHVFNTAGTLANKAFLDELWIMAMSETCDVLSKSCSYCTDGEAILGIKDLLVLFSTTLDNYGYPVGKLLDLLTEMKDHYNEVLMTRWVGVFRQILDEETFSPIQVSDEDEVNAIKAVFPFMDNVTSGYPRKLAFSSMVPKVYQQVREYIYACLKFSADLDVTHEAINDMIKKSTTLLLTKTFSGSLSATFKKPGLGLLQVVQIITDIGYLEEATVFLDELMTSATGGGDAPGRKQAMFNVAREDAERQISFKLREKMDEFLELENYDWALGEPQGHASSFITDMMAFLNSVFASLVQCPRAVAIAAARTACTHIATRILNAMLSDDVKQLTMGALQQVNLDTLQCEQWAASEPVPGLVEGELLQAFARLRQLLNLVISSDWNAYFHDFGQESSKYPNLPPATVEKLLEKLTDNKNMFSVLKRSERDKKKLLDTVLKQLKQLALTTQQPD